MASVGPLTSPGPSAARILIVEDEMLIGMDLQDLLQRGGYQVMDLAPTNRQALASLVHLRPDAVLLDCSLSDGHAKPVARVLLAARIPFAVMSGHMEAELADECFATAPRLTKPFASDAVLEMVRKLTTGQLSTLRAETVPAA